MTPRNKLQIFISSTYSDLRPERQMAVETIVEAGHIPAGMELFNSENEAQISIIQDWIRASDVYLLIIGRRYGSIEKESRKSYTQLEYEFATSLGKPIIILNLGQSYEYEDDGIEDERNNDGYKEFLSVFSQKLYRIIPSKEDFKYLLSLEIQAKERDLPRTGWISLQDHARFINEDILCFKDGLRNVSRTNYNQKDYPFSLLVSEDTIFFVCVHTNSNQQRFVVYYEVEHHESKKTHWIGFKNFGDTSLEPKEYTTALCNEGTNFVILKKVKDSLREAFPEYKDEDDFTIKRVRTRGDEAVNGSVDFHYTFLNTAR